MSAKYKKPGTEVEILLNPRIVNIGDSTRIPGIVGSGPTTRTYQDIALVRSTGSVDYLAEYPTTGVSVSKVAYVPNVASSNNLLRSAGGNLYNLATASVSALGSITWPSAVSDDIPVANSVYYASYIANVSSTQYNPVTYTDGDDIQTIYGSENTTTGILTIAGKLVLENGSPAVTICQASSSVQGYKDALDKLLKKTNIEDVVVVFPTTFASADRSSVINYALSHLDRAAAIHRERGLIFGSYSTDYAAGGFDTIGDISTSNTYLYTASTVKNEDVQYVVPSKCTRNIDGTDVTLDGNFIAAALAGKRASRDRRSTPLHGANIAGVSIEDEKWSEFEMDQLGAGSCTVIESRSGILSIRDHITTDPTSADTQEPSVIDAKRLVLRTLRTVLDNTYSNKGIVITDSTPGAVQATTNTALYSLVKDSEISAYGQTNNPITGEVATTAVRNLAEPRQIDVTCSFSPLYPLKWIKVTVSMYV